VPLTPGAYLKRQRLEAGLTIADVAARLATEPRIAEHARIEWLELIEADAMPLLFTTVIALRTAYPFDLAQLERLALLRLLDPGAPPAVGA
jgi:hypothetical protein